MFDFAHISCTLSSTCLLNISFINLLLGLQGALAAAFGIILGGVMMQKLQPTLHRIALWIIIISLAVTALSIGTFLFVCPQRDLGGTINPDTKM